MSGLPSLPCVEVAFAVRSTALYGLLAYTCLAREHALIGPAAIAVKLVESQVTLAL